MVTKAEPKVGVLMGSQSDFEIMGEVGKIFESFGVPFELKITSAHRTPKQTAAYVEAAEGRGLQVLIAGAGMAAHLAGVVAAHTVLPVIGVPIDASSLKGMDALLATIQMPGGIPVAGMAIGKAGAKNAALLAVAILALSNPELKTKLKQYRAKMTEDVIQKDQALQQS